MRFLPCGAAAVLVEVESLAEVVDLHAALRAQPPAGVIDLVPAARTLLLTYDVRRTSYPRVVDDVKGRDVGTAAAERGELVEIPVVYDGEDLPEVARHSGLDEREVVSRHQRPEYVVAFCGFSPGFAYIAGGDPALRVPRRASPRTRVPAGSVALADEFSGVYPRAAPGGWQLIGRTEAVLWDLDRDPPALLPPGTRVRFVERSG